MLDIFLHSYKFQREIIKKKIEFSSGKQRNNCNEIQIDMIEYTCIITRVREKKTIGTRSFPFFLEKSYGYVLL